MKYTLSFALFLTAVPCYPQTTCTGQIMPIKPTMSCSNPAPICVTDSYGFHAHWVWGCPSSPGLDPALIPLMVRPSQPAPSVEEAERLRQLRLQNQILERQLRDATNGSSVGSSPTAPEYSPFQSKAVAVCAQANAWKTDSMFNGCYWLALSKQERNAFLSGFGDGVMSVLLAHKMTNAEQEEVLSVAWPTKLSYGEIAAGIDRVYASTENLRTIPITGALFLVCLRSQGFPEEAIEKAAAALRSTENK